MVESFIPPTELCPYKAELLQFCKYLILASCNATNSLACHIQVDDFNKGRETRKGFLRSSDIGELYEMKCPENVAIVCNIPSLKL
jgi:hypothetical protein